MKEFKPIQLIVTKHLLTFLSSPESSWDTSISSLLTIDFEPRIRNESLMKDQGEDHSDAAALNHVLVPESLAYNNA